MRKVNKKNKRFNNKGPKYFEKLNRFRKKVQNFFKKESKRKHGRKLNHGR